MDTEIVFIAIGKLLITLHKDTILDFTRVQFFPRKLLTRLLQYILLCILHVVPLCSSLPPPNPKAKIS